MSAPPITSASVRASVSTAQRAFHRSISASRPEYTTPATSVTTTFSRFSPMLDNRSRHASAAAPAPDATSRTSPMDLPTSSRALRTAAPTMIAVPC